MSPELWWYTARAGGIVALALTGASVFWGLLVSTRVLQGRPSPKWLLDLHRFLGGSAVVFTIVHVLALVADSYVHFGWMDVLIPFASAWNPVAVGLGVIAAYLLIAVQGSSMLMKRLPRRLWKWIHLSSYGLFWLGLVHGAMAGTDAGNPLYIAGTALGTMAVLFLTLYRSLAQRRARSRAVRAVRPEPAAVEA
ncbi:MAG: ferric reductase-like transmembrane domain-containing protein [Actinomycetota bacterium]